MICNALLLEDSFMKQQLLTFVKSIQDSVERSALLKTFQTVLSPPSGGCAVECAFSLAGLIDTPRRNRLDPKTFEMLLVVQRFIAQSPDKTGFFKKTTETLRNDAFNAF